MPMTTAEQAKAKAEAQKEAERQAMERLKASIQERIKEMRTLSPPEAERAHEWVKNTCNNDKKLSGEFKRWAATQARNAECAANMRATTKALDDAIDFAHKEMMEQRSNKLALGRQWFSKACSLGADQEFRKATQRLIDTAMMTGGVYKPGQATKAKPLDTAPKNPNQAKIPTPTSAPVKA